MSETRLPTAVISDIHANAEALKVVLADIDRRATTPTVSLGDIVVYGPDPPERGDLVPERCAWSLMGNHDTASPDRRTSAGAEAAAFWTRTQCDNEPDAGLRAQRYELLGGLRVRIVETEPGMEFALLAVHGSPRRPINEYIFPDDAVNAPEKLEGVFERVDRLAIVGHTHVPGVFTDEPDFYPPDELCEMTYRFRPGEKAVINVGSVGQPRDHDPRASYVVLHPDRAEFIRLPYDTRATADKIRQIPELPDWLGERLFDGR